MKNAAKEIGLGILFLVTMPIWYPYVWWEERRYLRSIGELPDGKPARKESDDVASYVANSAIKKEVCNADV